MPRKVARLIRTCLLYTAGLLVAVIAAGSGFRAYFQHLAAEELAIRSPNGVQEGRFVAIGGIKQWVQIRGDDQKNPVLLYVHGGPGSSTLPISSGWRPWEKYFTIVQWDQRGAGRTYGETGDAVAPTMTLDRMTQDGIELAEYLRTRFLRSAPIDRAVLERSFHAGIPYMHRPREHHEAVVGLDPGQARAYYWSDCWSQWTSHLIGGRPCVPKATIDHRSHARLVVEDASSCFR